MIDESLHNDWIKDTIIQDVDSLSKKLKNPIFLQKKSLHSVGQNFVTQ